MTAQVIPIKPPTINALIEQTKAAWDRADEKKADTNDWYVRTGKLLVELKARIKEEGGKWLPALKKLGRSQRRANELMRAAGGIETIEWQRERKRKSVQKSRAKKSALRSADLDEPENYAEQTPEERWQYSLANICGDVLAIQSYWDKHFKGWKNFDCPSHIKKLVREAATEFTALTLTVTKR